jgi:hypothetical protein
MDHTGMGHTQRFRLVCRQNTSNLVLDPPSIQYPNTLDMVRPTRPWKELRSRSFPVFRYSFSFASSFTFTFENEIIDMDEDTHKKLDKIIELLSEIKENTDPMNPWNDVGSKIGYLDDEVKKIVEILKEKK